MLPLCRRLPGNDYSGAISKLCGGNAMPENSPLSRAEWRISVGLVSGYSAIRVEPRVVPRPFCGMGLFLCPIPRIHNRGSYES